MMRRCKSSFLLALATILLLSSMPTLSAEAQTKRTRKPAPKLLVPAGTQLKVRINDTLSSKESRSGDKFTATVINPSRYEEAKVAGHIRTINKSGRVKGKTSMSLA